MQDWIHTSMRRRFGEALLAVLALGSAVRCVTKAPPQEELALSPEDLATIDPNLPAVLPEAKPDPKPDPARDYTGAFEDAKKQEAAGLKPPGDAPASKPERAPLEREEYGSGPQKFYVKAVVLNVRAQPNRHAKIQRYFKQGDIVHVKPLGGGWAQLGEQEYVRTRWLVTKETPIASDEDVAKVLHQAND